jgi:hypothetical protein
MRVVTAATVLTLSLFASPLAMAQTAPPASPATPPAARAPSASQPQWYTLRSDDIRASKLIGTSVKNDANETIGSINELVFGRDGRIAAVVIGVGGFLGIGEREVGVNFESLRVSHDTNGRLVAMLNLTKDTLKSAPAWTWGSERSGGMPPAYRANPPTDTTRK